MADARVDADEIAGWLRLINTPGVGPVACRALLSAFGLPDAIFSASRDQLARVVPPVVASALKAATDDALVEKTIAWAAESGNHVVTLADPRYPRALLEITDPPPLLYAKGRIDLLEREGLAIVGSRNATPQGLIDARRFAEALARAGTTIVSGLALGIDGAAHQGALAAGPEGASTIALIGTGADVVYPAAHRALAHRIADEGLILSEFPLGTSAQSHHFPRRNRLIAGLARGVLVVEAAPQSGSLITARLAAESGREVFAIPGSIHSPLSKGCHRLIREGAKLVESVADILDELRIVAPHGTTAPPEPIPATQQRLLDAMGADPLPVDTLAERTASSIQELASELLALELAGRLVRLPGQRVQRLAID